MRHGRPHFKLTQPPVQSSAETSSDSGRLGVNGNGVQLCESHLVDQRAHQGVGSLFAEEPLRVVQEDLVETVEDVLQQQTALLFTSTRGEQQLSWTDELSEVS